MKVIQLIVFFQTVLLIVLLWRTALLDQQLGQLAEQLTIQTEQQAVSRAGHSLGEATDSTHIIDDPASRATAMRSPTIAQIRLILREELSNAALNLADTGMRLEADIQQLETEPQLETDEFKLVEIEQQIDYLLSDGDFTQADLIAVESQLLTLNSTNRRRILNKMTQSMTKAGVPLSQ